jgi:osmotically-inducible protein OsmY
MNRNRFEREDLRRRTMPRDYGNDGPQRRGEYFEPRRGGGMRSTADRQHWDAEGDYDADYDPGREHFEAQGRRFASETGNLRRYDSDRASSYQGPVYPAREFGGDDRPGRDFGDDHQRGASGWFVRDVVRPDWDRGELAARSHYSGRVHVYGGNRASDDFAGRGPTTYRRNDTRIHEDICEHLTEHAQIDASRIDVEVRDGEVTLSGYVATREQKRLAEDIAEITRGVRQVHNTLRVRADDSAPGDERTMTGERLSVDRRFNGR